MKRHKFAPSYGHMGDCGICGHIHNDPIHQSMKEEVARAICRERNCAGNCREENVPCKALKENLLHDTNIISHQADAAIKVMLERCAEAVKNLAKE